MLWTNEKIGKIREKYIKKESSDLRDTDITEIKGLFGLLYYTSVFKSNHESLHLIFATDGTGREIFRCVTSQKRFLVLLTCLRFDNPHDREERKKNDPLAPISNLFNLFIKRCLAVYIIGSCATIDEMLTSFRGKCKFKMYMPMKPC